MRAAINKEVVMNVSYVTERLEVERMVPLGAETIGLHKKSSEAEADWRCSRYMTIST